MNIVQIKERIENDYLFGGIKLNNTVEVYLMPIAWWILNYKMYDPFYDPNAWKEAFRDHIYNVTDDQIDKFVFSIKDDKLSLNDSVSLVNEISIEDRFLYFFVNFDEKIFINGFSDISLENYLPDNSWLGIFDSPSKYLPLELKDIFL